MTPGDDLGRFRYLELCNIHVVLAVGLELNFRKSPNPQLGKGGPTTYYLGVLFRAHIMLYESQLYYIFFFYYTNLNLG